MSSDESWAEFMKARFNRKNHSAVLQLRSSIWPGIRKFMQTILDNSKWLIGNGSKVNFWRDCWLAEPVSFMLNIPENMQGSCCASVNNFIRDKAWHFPASFSHDFPGLLTEIRKVIIPKDDDPDALVWKHSDSGLLSLKEAYGFLNPLNGVDHWCRFLWKSFIPPSKSF